MKKVVLIILALILGFIALLYVSLWSTEEEFASCKILSFDEVDSINFRNHDSVLVAASTLYTANDVKRLMQGQQYRKAWATPVKVPILFLDTLFGGVEILKEGGGKQTHSLKLKATNGIIYTLRSINKDPQPLVPDFARTLGLENIIVDGISAQHPYGALLAAQLATRAGVLHTNPKAVFLPEQNKLGKYNKKYGNRLFLLEYETKGAANWTGLKHIKSLMDTEDLQELKLKIRSNLKIDKNALIRARLFDILIGDWDRHTKQWGWAIQQKDSMFTAIPIPGDRDNAFFNPNGILPSILSNKNVIPELRPYEDDIDFMEGLVYPFDRYFLLDTPKDVFIDQAKQLQKLLSDEAIESSLKVWPKAIRDLDGKDISDKIKKRREKLTEYASKFKQIIDEQGVVLEALKGSDDVNSDTSFFNCFECD